MRGTVWSARDEPNHTYFGCPPLRGVIIIKKSANFQPLTLNGIEELLESIHLGFDSPKDLLK